MAGLRTLLELGGATSTALSFDEIYVFNNNKVSPNNGGQCCLFTVPAGTAWFAVEMWGGGGGGAGACCCQQCSPGGAGSYARKFVTGLSGGEQYTICAAGSSCCASSCRGCSGFPSFVSVSGGSVEVCASGGSVGCTKCFFGDGCNRSGCQQTQSGCWQGGMGICGVTGSAKGSSFCNQSSWQMIPSAPFTPGGARGSMSHCVNCHGCQVGGVAHWPGGGGASASAHGGNSWNGAPGAGGLVIVYYGVPS